MNISPQNINASNSLTSVPSTPLAKKGYNPNITTNKIEQIRSQSIGELNIPSPPPEVVDRIIAADKQIITRNSKYNPPEIDNDNIFYKEFFNEKTVAFLSDAKVSQMVFGQALSREPNNIQFKFNFIRQSIKLMECLRDIQKSPNEVQDYNKYLQNTFKFASEQADLALNINPADANSHFIKALLEEFKGVNVKDLNQVINVVKLLLLAQSLDSQSEEIRDNFDRTVDSVKIKWNKLSEEATEISEKEKYQDWNKQLNSLLKGNFVENSLKEMFIKNPSLFEKVRDNQPLLDRFPFLKNQEKFNKKFGLSSNSQSFASQGKPPLPPKPSIMGAPIPNHTAAPQPRPMPKPLPERMDAPRPQSIAQPLPRRMDAPVPNKKIEEPQPQPTPALMPNKMAIPTPVPTNEPKPQVGFNPNFKSSKGHIDAVHRSLEKSKNAKMNEVNLFTQTPAIDHSLAEILVSNLKKHPETVYYLGNKHDVESIKIVAREKSYSIQENENPMFESTGLPIYSITSKKR